MGICGGDGQRAGGISQPVGNKTHPCALGGGRMLRAGQAQHMRELQEARSKGQQRVPLADLADEQQACAAVAQDVGDVLGIIRGVERYDHEPERLRRLVETHPLDAVAKQHGNPLAGRQLLPRECGLPARSQVPHLAPGVALPSPGCRVILPICLGVRGSVATAQEQTRQGTSFGTADQIQSEPARRVHGGTPLS